jgi:hypothetical protein
LMVIVQGGLAPSGARVCPGCSQTGPVHTRPGPNGDLLAKLGRQPRG